MSMPISSPASHLPLSFFFNNAPTTKIYTLSLHDALPISQSNAGLEVAVHPAAGHVRHRQRRRAHDAHLAQDRKSTRLNSSHQIISYAVFCLKKKRIIFMVDIVLVL